MNLKENHGHLEAQDSTRGIVEQFKYFAHRCEELQLHALAAYVFEKLMTYDPANKGAYFKQYLSNVQQVVIE